MARKSVVITGAAGFIGSHLTERCLSLGWRVTAIDSFTDYYSAAIKRTNIGTLAAHPNCTVVDGDLLSMDLAPLLADVAIVFHLAAQPGVRASWDEFRLYTDLNVNATQRLLETSCNASLERFVLASSSSIYGDAESLPTPEDMTPRPVSPYGITKVAAEHLAQVYWRNFAVPAVCLRYFTVYGPRQRPDMAFHRLISRALAEEPFEMFGDGNQTRDFTFVTDAVAGTIAAGQCAPPGSAYNIGGGSRRSMNSVLDSLGSLVGAPIDRVYRSRQLGDARDTAADITRAKRDLGFEPAFDFEAGLAAQLEWQRATLASIGSIG
jgi:nucleoside-diphosphate-sugar epimerase